MYRNSRTFRPSHELIGKWKDESLNVRRHKKLKILKWNKPKCVRTKKEWNTKQYVLHIPLTVWMLCILSTVYYNLSLNRRMLWCYYGDLFMLEWKTRSESVKVICQLWSWFQTRKHGIALDIHMLKSYTANNSPLNRKKNWNNDFSHLSKCI